LVGSLRLEIGFSSGRQIKSYPLPGLRRHMEGCQKVVEVWPIIAKMKEYVSEDEEAEIAEVEITTRI